MSYHDWPEFVSTLNIAKKQQVEFQLHKHTFFCFNYLELTYKLIKKIE